MVTQLLSGSSAKLTARGDPLDCEAVTSPGGTTAAGLNVFNEQGLLLVANAVTAAKTRSRELGAS